MKSHEVKFSDTSRLTYRMFIYDTAPDRGKFSGDSYLLIEFVGTHGIGSEGNGDSLFMETIINSALNVWFVQGLVLDLSELSYEWGDSLADVPLVGKQMFGNRFPTAVVASEKCRPALESLSPFFKGAFERGGQEQWFFEDVSSALQYVKERAEALKPVEEQSKKKKYFWRW
ncbi:MAG TPA: hypothetical protein VKB46_00655 [Pyrinomonadaceae bacterium]|nr:hypothetical protein [Pyrinomonadaceae bacterium]